MAARSEASTLGDAERSRLAVAAASDTAKSVLTLSTAILSFTVVFRNDVVANVLPTDEKWLWFSWVLLLVGIVGGVMTLLALARVIGRTTESLSNYNWWVRVPTAIQIVGFLGGLAMLVIFGVTALTGDGPGVSTDRGSCVIEAPATGQCSLEQP